MDTRGSGRIAYEDEQRIGIFTAARIVVPVVAVVIVDVVVVAVPRHMQVAFAHIVNPHGVCVDAVVAVIVQEQPIGERHPHQQ